MDGLAFISYSRDDTDLIERLVKFLSENQIPVWWDTRLQGGDVINYAIEQQIDKAACVVVAWTASSVTRDWVVAEAEEGRKRQILVPLLFDKDIRIPMPFGIYHHFDLTDEDFLSKTEIQRLLGVLTNIIKYGKPVSVYIEKLTDGWSVNRAIIAANELRDIVSRLGSLAEIMVMESKPVTDIKLALAEIGKTYDVVNKSIEKFLLPLQKKHTLPLKPFIEMERGALDKIVKQGHGHCTLIETHYKKFGGLRSIIKPLISDQQIDELDNIFSKLGTADGDLFFQMTGISDILKNESGAIANLLLCDQQQIARERLVNNRTALIPLEKCMNEAFAELQKISQTFGAVM